MWRKKSHISILDLKMGDLAAALILPHIHYRIF